MDDSNPKGPQTKRKGKDIILTEPFEHEKFSVRESQSEGKIN